MAVGADRLSERLAKDEEVADAEEAAEEADIDRETNDMLAANALQTQR